MATVAKPLPVNEYQQFRYQLFEESPRAAYWLESMVFGIMAQMDDITEDTALELACKIVAHDRPPPQVIAVTERPRTNGKQARRKK
jgi:hypothetical protein